MSRKSKLSKEEKLWAVKEYQSGRISKREIAQKYGVYEETVRDWIRLYETFGEKGLCNGNKNTTYSDEEKNSAVEAYSECGSLREVCKIHRISSTSVLRRWISCHNEGIQQKTRSTFKMSQGRKTTQAERVEIVAFCIESGKDYYATVDKYKVSYQQVYSWVRKFEHCGVDGLIDGRGRTPPKSKLTETDRLKAENRLLEAKNRDLEMENELLKKVHFLRGGGRLAE